MKSNINITSNIYIRDPLSLDGSIDRLQNDPKFVKQVKGLSALKKLKDIRVNLSPAQEEEFSQSSTCSYGAKGETTHGVVQKNGDYIYECRCESPFCKLKDECKPYIFNRNNSVNLTDDESDNELDGFEWIGIEKNDDIDELFEDKSSCVTDDEENRIFYEDVTENECNVYVEINSDEAILKIIEDDIKSHIWVNAGPGTGKTYTAIQRLKYVLNNIDPEDSNMVLVMCYTRAAVSEIKNRIEFYVSSGELPPEAKNVTICTFDSLATNYLISIETPPEALNALDYNQRISLFNE
ncbi:MAG: UvrD-helicase domain-containing protein [Ruminiclostridium sp.]|nr:UvrD-helicase domain-containing protein [Ruminiclostridium sp.]